MQLLRLGSFREPGAEIRWSVQLRVYGAGRPGGGGCSSSTGKVKNCLFTSSRPDPGSPSPVSNVYQRFLSLTVKQPELQAPTNDDVNEIYTSTPSFRDVVLNWLSIATTFRIIQREQKLQLAG